MLWNKWNHIVWQLRPAFKRYRTFQWFVILLAAMTVRSDFSGGVSSFIRALGLAPQIYTSAINFFHSDAIHYKVLSQYWVETSFKIFASFFTKINGKILLVGDGIKIPKEGKRMPGVKLLHQSSQSNSKAEYIMGHSLQALSVIVSAGASFMAVPLICHIHEGLKTGPNDKKTLMDKFLDLIVEINLKEEVYLVADAYYGSGSLAKDLLSRGVFLISRIRKNAVAYYPSLNRTKRPGRPKKYGEKVKMMDLFSSLKFLEIPSPVYGEKNIILKYSIIDLMWISFGGLIRYCLVDHPTRGKCIFITTDLKLSGPEIIKAYGLRYKIEYSFKELIHNIGGFCYRFWMSSMEKTKRRTGNRYLHRKPESYLLVLFKKMNAYHLYIQMGLISQGLCQYLSIVYPDSVWSLFNGWLRTIRPGLSPSVQVVQNALRSSLSEFFVCFPNELKWRIFLKKILPSWRSPRGRPKAA